MAEEFWGLRTFCLVTGASQGIGRSFAVEFARKFAPGSRLVLLARSVAGLKQTEALILAANPHVSVQIHSLDLSKPDPAEFKAVLHQENQGEGYELSVLIHNAGSVGKVEQLTADMDDPQEWHRYLSLNLYHVTMLTAEFLRTFPSGKRCIINITSLCAIKPHKSMGYYCVGKSAREMYFRVLVEENPGLDVLNYSPGPVDTDMVSEVIKGVKDSDIRQTFMTLKNSNTLVTLEETTKKLITVLAAHAYKSGGRIDYYDPL